jgi:hypothetical protein
VFVCLGFNLLEAFGSMGSGVYLAKRLESTRNPRLPTMHHQPSSDYPRPQTLDPRPCTTDPRHSALDPQLSKPSTLETLDPRPSTCHGLGSTLRKTGNRLSSASRSSTEALPRDVPPEHILWKACDIHRPNRRGQRRHVDRGCMRLRPLENGRRPCRFPSKRRGRSVSPEARES